MTFSPGTQIAYVPAHACGDINHPDVEFGFVTSTWEKIVFCRFWSNDDSNRLRTVANSESVLANRLLVHETHPQRQIDVLLQQKST